MTTVDLFHREYSALMRYTQSALIDIASESYGLDAKGMNKEDIAAACANIEVSNYLR